MSRMSSQSLYKICLQETYTFLRKGIWKASSSNPFKGMPSQIVDELMELLVSHDLFKYRPCHVKYTEVMLLLTSGVLTRLDLCSFNLEYDLNYFLKLVPTNCWKSVRFLKVFVNDTYSISLIDKLIVLCLNLEEFHSNYLPDLAHFKNCKELRALRCCSNQLEFYLNNAPKPCQLTSLKKLNEFFWTELNSYAIAAFLQHCPQLITFGTADSLGGLKMIRHKLVSPRTCHGNSLPSPIGVCDHYKLRKCVWGTDIEDIKDANIFPHYLPSDFPVDIPLYKSQFSDNLQAAIAVCPLVEELVVNVPCPNSILQLKELKKLTLLSLNFRHCDGDYLSSLIKLLEIIGARLLHLSVTSPLKFPLDIIFQCCPNLKTLEIKGHAFVTSDNLIEDFGRVLLKRLRITNIDQRNLLILLSSCRYLEEILLGKVVCFDDDLLNKVLNLNPLAELKMIGMEACSLSERGFCIFLEKAVSLQQFYFGQNNIVRVNRIIQSLNLTNVKHLNSFSKENFNFFYGKLVKSRF